MLHPLCPQGRSSQYPLNRRLDDPRSVSKRFGEEKYLLILPGMEPVFVGYIAVAWSLHRLCYRIYLNVKVRVCMNTVWWVGVAQSV